MSVFCLLFCPVLCSGGILVSQKVREERIAKLELLRSRGVHPYPTKFKVTHSSSSVLSSFETLEREETIVSLAGRLVSKRKHGKASFGHIQDRTGKLQLYFREDNLGKEAYELLTMFDVGDILGVSGPVFRTRTDEITVKVQTFELLSKSLRPLPEKWHGLRDVETRYRQRYVDLIVNAEVRELMAARSRIITTMRNFLDARGFIEVETPILQPLYGGAFARPFVTHHEVLDMDLYLRIADELYLKRLIVGGMERVYEIGKDFRNEGIDRTHNPEFTVLELYQAYADYMDMMELFEELVCKVVTELFGELKCTYGEHSLDFSRPWKRLSYFEALSERLSVDLREATTEDVSALCAELGMDVGAILARVKPGKESRRERKEESRGSGTGGAARPGIDEPMARERLLDELFSEKVQPHIVQPTFVYDYPKEISPLAKEKVGSTGIAERFEPIIAGLELGNAFSEQNDPTEQARQFDEQTRHRERGDAEAQPKDLDYLRALEYGMPPAGGIGVGIDRLTMILTNSRNIREVILFPHLRPEASLGEDEADEL
jgi:lysyl-tRNA synthetase class 2